MFDVNNRNTRTRCETCSKFTIKIPERRHCSTVSIVNFEQVNAGWEMKNWSWLVTSFFNFSGLVTVGFLSVKSSWVKWRLTSSIAIFNQGASLVKFNWILRSGGVMGHGVGLYIVGKVTFCIRKLSSCILSQQDFDGAPLKYDIYL